MPNIRTKDDVMIYYNDMGQGQPVLFSHGWPLSSDAWEDQMMYLANRGYRVIAHDRRGHGRSQRTAGGNDMDTFADDLSQLIESLDLENLILIGHSTGGGEVTRYIGRHGTDRVAGIVLVSAVPPGLLQTEKNPNGIPMNAFDQIREGVASDRSQYYKELAVPFFGANRKGAKVSQGSLDNFWRISMDGGLMPEYECIRAFSETDFTDDLKKFDVPTLVIHGDDDQIVPYPTALRTIELVKHAELKTYEGGPHGLAVVAKQRLSEDILKFVEANTTSEKRVTRKQRTSTPTAEQALPH